MTILGVLLILVGVGAAGLLFTGNAPEQLLSLPLPVWAWLVLAVVGAVLIVMNRRPND
jgi:hypothetical protein